MANFIERNQKRKEKKGGIGRRTSKRLSSGRSFTTLFPFATYRRSSYLLMNKDQTTDPGSIKVILQSEQSVNEKEVLIWHLCQSGMLDFLEKGSLRGLCSCLVSNPYSTLSLSGSAKGKPDRGINGQPHREDEGLEDASKPRFLFFFVYTREIRTRPHAVSFFQGGLRLPG